MDPQEERKIEHKVKKEQGVGDPENLYASVANGIPNERDNGGDFDAVNAGLGQGGLQASHTTNINTQTNLELGGLEDPGGLDPALDNQYLHDMKKKLRENL